MRVCYEINQRILVDMFQILTTTLYLQPVRD